MGGLVSVDSEDIKNLSNRVGDMDKRMYHMENVIPELAENVKALTKVITNQAVQDEFNRNIERRTLQSESEIANVKSELKSEITTVRAEVKSNTHSIWKIIAYLAAGVSGGVSIASLFPPG